MVAVIQGAHRDYSRNWDGPDQSNSWSVLLRQTHGMQTGAAHPTLAAATESAPKASAAEQTGQPVSTLLSAYTGLQRPSNALF